MPPFTRILVATDFSEGANRALATGAELATSLALPLVIVHVYLRPVVVEPSGRAHPARDTTRDLVEAELALARNDARERGAAQVETVLAEGESVTGILRTAADRACDLIVVGAHGRSSALELGSVAYQLVRRAGVSVLVVEPRR